MVELREMYFNDEPKARLWLERVRWLMGPICTFCRSSEVCKLKGGASDKGQFKCRSCRKKFTVRTGTMLANSRLELRKWLKLINLLGTRPWGLTAREMEIELDISHKTALSLHKRIRQLLILAHGRDNLPCEQLMRRPAHSRHAKRTALERGKNGRCKAISLYPLPLDQVLYEMGLKDTRPKRRDRVGISDPPKIKQDRPKSNAKFRRPRKTNSRAHPWGYDEYIEGLRRSF